MTLKWCHELLLARNCIFDVVDFSSILYFRLGIGLAIKPGKQCPGQTSFSFFSLLLYRRFLTSFRCMRPYVHPSILQQLSWVRNNLSHHLLMSVIPIINIHDKLKTLPQRYHYSYTPQFQISGSAMRKQLHAQTIVTIPVCTLTCVLSRLHCICWPVFVFCRCRSADVMAPTAYKPVAMSIIATPTRHGSPSWQCTVI